ncbi:hypothetical protein L1987_61207 [Smallanthus sonchifolius]|uniref:Uncharacterized protein n=1 Tax=Smallanthus sonchifolius TaxID=185202 RepID=A0ACB9DA88_9ASTR|nr:hypothetical protein L1987_61207 [Smallanthus sonchifolius]
MWFILHSITIGHLLSVVSNAEDYCSSRNRSVSYFSTLLEKDDRSVGIVAGEALAISFEIGNLEKFSIQDVTHSSTHDCFKASWSYHKSVHLEFPKQLAFSAAHGITL